jgi:hypothetical protein
MGSYGTAGRAAEKGWFGCSTATSSAEAAMILRRLRHPCPQLEMRIFLSL